MQQLRTLHLFAGAGGGIFGDLLLGHQPVCAVEINEYCQQVLSARQKDGCFPWFPIFPDVTQFDGNEWRGKVDIVSGGFPCQDISCAGKGAGIDGERSVLWSEMARIIGEVRPRYAFIENSPMLVTRGLDRVLCDLAAMGFDAEWGVIGAHHVGAPHKRDRVWIVAYANVSECGKRPVVDEKRRRQKKTEQIGVGSFRCVHDAESIGCGETRQHRPNESEELACWCGADANAERYGLENEQQGRAKKRTTDRPRNGSNSAGWPPEPGVCRVVDGVANWKHRIFSLGNGQVPRVAATAWRILSERAAES